MVEIMTKTLPLFHLQRSSDWIDEDSLFTSGLSVCPLNAKVMGRLPWVLQQRLIIQKEKQLCLFYLFICQNSHQIFVLLVVSFDLHRFTTMLGKWELKNESYKWVRNFIEKQLGMSVEGLIKLMLLLVRNVATLMGWVLLQPCWTLVDLW